MTEPPPTLHTRRPMDSGAAALGCAQAAVASVAGMATCTGTWTPFLTSTLPPRVQLLAPFLAGGVVTGVVFFLSSRLLRSSGPISERESPDIVMPSAEREQPQADGAATTSNAAGFAALLIPPVVGFMIGGGLGGMMAREAGLAPGAVWTEGVMAGGVVGGIVGLALGVPASLMIYFVSRRK